MPREDGGVDQLVISYLVRQHPIVHLLLSHAPFLLLLASAKLGVLGRAAEPARAEQEGGLASVRDCTAGAAT